MKNLPEHIVPYKKTPTFDQDTVPKGLLKAHQTKAGVWGKIVILEGELEYTINEPETEVIILSPQRYGVVEPTIYHQVKPLGAVKFYVEFHH
ncbi:DUF1971 domain-containing protein [Oceanicoccus sagamiensis]|uniref:Tellurite resistance protein n=1 Tax=Oceanicoccus sagamiensis TaxID=716816 RepID=A0A1X9NIE5_9GAMM|nr:DUF1971 domain-containing protein [Oceanicoccus sagamiensis]ARN73753.1 tellurite resistance protein [Oceanicoccus sagamiensis]